MTEEVQAAAKDGVSCIVDGGHADMGTDVEFLRLLSRRSGMPIVKGGGYYRQLTYPPRIAKMAEAELVEELVRHARDERWGAFGEIGTSDEITPDERKMLRAVGKAHVRTGLPIFSHTANGKAAIEQLDIFEAEGVDVNHLVIGHMCCYFDPNPWRQVHAAIAKRGALRRLRPGGRRTGRRRQAACRDGHGVSRGRAMRVALCSRRTSASGPRRSAAAVTASRGPSRSSCQCSASAGSRTTCCSGSSRTTRDDSWRSCRRVRSRP